MSHIIIFYLSLFSHTSIAPNFSWLLFAWNVFSHFILTLFMSLDLKWVFWRQHIVESYIFLILRKKHSFFSTSTQNPQLLNTSDTSGHQMYGICPHLQQLSSSVDTNWVSYNLTQLPHHLPGHSIRSHRLRAQSQNTAHSSDANHKSRFSPELLTNWL